MNVLLHTRKTPHILRISIKRKRLISGIHTEPFIHDPDFNEDSAHYERIPIHSISIIIY